NNRVAGSGLGCSELSDWDGKLGCVTMQSDGEIRNGGETSNGGGIRHESGIRHNSEICHDDEIRHDSGIRHDGEITGCLHERCFVA
ncbi:MAG: hypothetical protein ACO2PL_07500, partial [Armatimonadota bacterium]